MPPTTTTRTTPTGKRMRDGHPTKIAFERLPGANFFEIEVPPPGIEGGDPIPTSTMHNTKWRTFAARALRTLTPFTVLAAYDPYFFTEAEATLVNDDGSVTVRFPDGSTLDFFGYLQNFIPQAHKEGEMPTGNLVVVPTNTDPTTGAEADPVFTNVTGT